VLLDEMAQQIARARKRQARQRSAVEALARNGIHRIQPRQIVQQFGGIGLQRGRAREGGAAAGKMRGQQRHHLLAQRIAAVADVRLLSSSTQSRPCACAYSSRSARATPSSGRSCAARHPGAPAVRPSPPGLSARRRAAAAAKAFRPGRPAGAR
jgi:hypothetical protein